MVLNHHTTPSMWSNNLHLKLTGVIALPGILPNISNMKQPIKGEIQKKLPRTSDKGPTKPTPYRIALSSSVAWYYYIMVGSAVDP